ncbi:hypothetical protein L202_03077 [Cryptococcus amylolentus CBS 6039]|uniref:HIT-type domain-containing protein n=2 Tax=Cryptococcus amylolentus TaxID=104669 RepID=A0A1E3HXU5_9TREE|nr:hypothetical protein L202_03077 [Cryptococcus amylolentus CBS 6039]ODN80965.1 hypothetical protein L202_03077 [Cryptococcus amylolentus CBS 6039]ODO09446.1 hypothetical protein I350_03046 [Cryptococcus amylolentus CBS 6273]
MSMNHPKPRQIRLPFDVPKPTKSVPQARICGICRKGDSRYTCPRCNVAYCSLDCFRSETHDQCSEPFYKTTVLDSISADPKVGLEEKKQMMDMLRRFEETEAEGGNGLEEVGSEAEDEDEELIKLFEGVDIESMGSNDIFKLLPPKHREAFIQALQNPDSEDTKALLEAASQDLLPQPPDVLPWWETEASWTERNGGDENDGPRVAEEPETIPESVLEGINPPDRVGKKLAYNAIALSMAYLHTLLSYRLPSLHPTHLKSQDVEASELKSYFNLLTPFLVEPKSTTRHESLGSAWGSVWEAISSDMDVPPLAETLRHLLGLIPDLLHPPITTPAYPRVLLILSDLYGLFTLPPGKVGGAVPRKVAFYVKALRQLDRAEWLQLESEIRKEVDKLEGESGDGEVKEERRERLEIV